jgi:signal transduction histidine kinase
VADEDLRALAAEQAALRRVATLVARGVPPDEVFAAVIEGVGRLLSVEGANMGRFGSDGSITYVATWGRAGLQLRPGTRGTLGGQNIATLVFETGRPARLDDYLDDASGQLGVTLQKLGLRSAIGTPIVVEGRLWGMIAVGSREDQGLPADIEARLATFTELVATAIANAESRSELARVAREQAALRRVATIVARRSPPEEVFSAVAEEVGTLLGADLAAIARYETGEMLTTLATWAANGKHPQGEASAPLEDGDLATRVLRTGRAARTDGSYGTPRADIREQLGIRSSVAGPIVVEGQIWGGLVVHSKQTEPLPAETESRLMHFSELVATAIANADSRAGLALLAKEQAALRRVATLVARRSPPEEMFAAVVEEVGRLLCVDMADMCRYEPDGTITFVATWGTADKRFAVGTRTLLGGRNLGTLIFETGGPVRIDEYADGSGPLSITARDRHLRSAVGAPITVDGRVWGMMGAGTAGEQPLPAATEGRLVSFTELVATAIADAQSRAELITSRARIVAAADETRRRIERDLHDGTQQQLVSVMLELRAAADTPPSEPAQLQAHLARIGRGLDGVLEELREISRGLHPAILSKAGLGPALKALARRSVLPVELDLRAERRSPEHLEVAAYYVVSEALTNATKHAHASVVNVELDVHDDMLQLAIRDDGIGGADPGQGSGLVGLADRIEALGGTLEITSPANRGTFLLVEIPVGHQSIAVSSESPTARLPLGPISLHPEVP